MVWDASGDLQPGDCQQMRPESTYVCPAAVADACLLCLQCCAQVVTSLLATVRHHAILRCALQSINWGLVGAAAAGSRQPVPCMCQCVLLVDMRV
jgi:hypothetical protein